MQSDFPVILDACVLAAPAVCDLYLRLAETPRLYTPHWSSEILNEVRRTQTSKFKKPYSAQLADYWRAQVTEAFPEALVTGWEILLPAMTNDAKDRHVLAAAVKAKSSLIVTFNLRHFPQSALKPHGVDALHPQDYLLTLWSMNPAVVMAKLAAMARNTEGRTEVQDVLLRLAKTLPRFSQHVLQQMGGDSGPIPS
jgi:predicted nucleic acid-binding protein